MRLRRRFSLEAPKLEVSGRGKELSARASALLADKEEFIRLLCDATSAREVQSQLVGLDAKRQREDWIRRRVEEGGVFGAEEAKAHGLIDEVRDKYISPSLSGFCSKSPSGEGGQSRRRKKSSPPQCVCMHCRYSLKAKKCSVQLPCWTSTRNATQWLLAIPVECRCMRLSSTPVSRDGCEPPPL